MCMMNEAPEIHFHSTTTLTAEQYVAGLTDFVLAEVLLQDSPRPDPTSTIAETW